MTVTPRTSAWSGPLRSSTASIAATPSMIVVRAPVHVADGVRLRDRRAQGAGPAGRLAEQVPGGLVRLVPRRVHRERRRRGRAGQGEREQQGEQGQMAQASVHGAGIRACGAPYRPERSDAPHS
ncbi:MAG: hypothetical protein MUC84_09675 [Solirubrobacteraceae bacterium]|nr:hypothetical protein [Solirubrobacteraceae bacterium]